MELTCWLIQPHAGVFVGRITARIRALLWQRVVKSLKDGAAILIYPADTEQGFAVETAGDTRRLIADFEGLSLVKSRNPT